MCVARKGRRAQRAPRRHWWHSDSDLRPAAVSPAVEALCCGLGKGGGVEEEREEGRGGVCAVERGCVGTLCSAREERAAHSIVLATRCVARRAARYRAQHALRVLFAWRAARYRAQRALRVRNALLGARGALHEASPPGTAAFGCHLARSPHRHWSASMLRLTPCPIHSPWLWLIYGARGVFMALRAHGCVRVRPPLRFLRAARC